MTLGLAAEWQEYEEALELASPVLETAFAQMGVVIESMRATIADACAAIDRALAGEAD